MSGGKAPEVLVAGAGAIGSVVGGLLAIGGAGVTLLGRPEHLGAIARRGLAIEGIWGRYEIKDLAVAADSTALRGGYDLVLLSVKSYDTDAMLEIVAPLLDRDGSLISLQNGLGNVEKVLAAVGPGRALGARVIFGAEIARPGVVRVTVCADSVLIGAVAAHDGRACQKAKRWAERFAASRIPCEYTPDLCAALWGKVLYNAPLNALAALLRVPYGVLAELEEAREIMNVLIEEAFGVALAVGVKLPWKQVEDYKRVFYGRLLPATREHRSSMLQDLERGRRTEVDSINGSVWRLGRRAGVPTVVNETITRLVHVAEEVRKLSLGNPQL